MNIDAARAPAFAPRVRSLLGAALLAPMLAGCFTVKGASTNAVPMVKVQAEGDLDCPQKEIRVVKDWGGRFEAIGCGHKKVYNTACDGLRCVVAPEGEAIPWRARPAPDDPLRP